MQLRVVLSLLFCIPADSYVWNTGGRGKGACTGGAAQNFPAVEVSGLDISLYSGRSWSGSCIYRTLDPPIDLDQTPQIEVDVRTSGVAGEWFSLWLDPVNYVQPPPMSGEIDMLENFNNVVGSNFAKCAHDCMEKGWNVAPTAVNHHITLQFDKSTRRVQVFHCAIGSPTCAGNDPNPAFIELHTYPIGGRPVFAMVADIWYSKPEDHLQLHVTNLKFGAPAPPPPPAPPSPGPSPTGHCAVGQVVQCPRHGDGNCRGDECCQDGTTCPSAAATFKGCPKGKAYDCTKTSSEMLVV